ncbi:hypothetical protein AB0N05_38620 [Nocardia sp. NPDC051030]|uniref:hypothetical protein n=1 Tax=Nocardia sp. NPDC051030 TaxID=3155162 RepID=UPI00344A516A
MPGGFQDWLKQISEGRSELAIAQHMDVNPSKVNRHLFDTSKPPVAQTVIDFCLAFAVNPVEGLIQAGLAPAEAFRLPIVGDRPAVNDALRSATNGQLVEELSRRLLETEQPAPGPEPTSPRRHTKTARRLLS